MHRVLAALLPLLMLLASPLARAQDQTDWLDIEVGKSIVLETPRNAKAIAITDPTVADVVPLASANKIQVQGKSVGSTDLVVQLGEGTAPIIYEITVHQDLSDLIRRVDAIVDGEPPRVYPLKERIVVEGPVDDLGTLERIALVASIYDEHFINLMTVRGDHQVQLEVVFAEVSRSALRQLGLNFMFGAGNFGGILQTPTTNPGSSFASSLLESLNGGVIDAAGNGAFNLAGFGVAGGGAFGAVLSILDEHKLSKIMAQPTIVTLSGQQGDFLSGGEIPIPVPSGSGQISIEYKEHGIKLVFVPTVLGGSLIDMRVQIEVSEPDFAAGTRVTGVEVPGFVSRKSKSHLRVDSGMTFAMAGLLSESTTWTRAEIPGLGRIPVVGTLFRAVRHEREETEVLILVTPRLVRPLGPGEVPAMPGTTENNNPSDLELFLFGADRRPGSRTAKPTGAVGLQR